VIRTFKKSGFLVVRQKGSQLEKISNGDIIKIIVPMHNPLKKGTLIRIIKDAGLTKDEFSN